MSDTFDAIHDLWKSAGPDKREEYLFKALVCFRNEFKTKFDSLNVSCAARMGDCNDRFVTRKQAKWALVVVLALALGVGIGSGYLTFKEFLTHATKIPI